MHHAKDINETVWGKPVKDQVPRLANPVFLHHQVASGLEVVAPDVAHTRHRPGTRQGGIGCDCVQGRKQQAVVACGALDAPVPGALKQECINTVISPPDEAIGHYSCSAASRSRKRAIFS